MSGRDSSVHGGWNHPPLQGQEHSTGNWVSAKGEWEGVKMGEWEGVKMGEWEGVKMGEWEGVKMGEWEGVKKGEWRV